jgi:poly-gamma-glutamate capsule biosynthesis protein CapA/YwtB (metallophosphatase superfamily)
MTPASHILWQSARSEPIAARVAIAGDFLPAGPLSLPPGGWGEAARNVAPIFEDVDVSFLNLESSLDTVGLPVRPLSGIGEIVSAESSSLDYLRRIHSKAVSIANNHAYDFGAAGVERTRSALAARNFVPLGAARSVRDTPEIFVWEGPADVCIGFWAAASASRDLATERTAGVEPATISRARLAAASLKSQGARYTVALLHCGCIRASRPDPSDAALMDGIASCGFDLVGASHSHRISGSRLIRTQGLAPAFCFYGLGSIVSGYIASPLEREGLVVVAAFHFDATLARVEVRPVWLAESGFGEVPPPEVARSILVRFLGLTAEIADGTSGRRFYEEVSPGIIPLYTRDLRAAFRQSGLSGLARKAGRIRPRHLRRLLHGVIR